MNSLPKTVTRHRRDCDLNPSPSAPESSTLTTRLPSHPRLLSAYYTPYYAVIVYATVGCPSVRLSRRSIASKQQRHAGGLLQLGRGRQKSTDSCRTRPRRTAASVNAVTRGTRVDEELCSLKTVKIIRNEKYAACAFLESVATSPKWQHNEDNTRHTRGPITQT